MQRRDVVVGFMVGGFGGEVKTAPALPWYLTDGLVAGDVIAAYQAKGAVSLEASLVNLANPGTNDLLTAGGPVLDANGWQLVAPAYLRTALWNADWINANVKTAITRFSGFGEGQYYMPCFDIGGSLYMRPYGDLGEGGPYGSRWCCGSAIVESSTLYPSGVMAITVDFTNNKVCGYMDGALIGERADPTGNGIDAWLGFGTLTEAPRIQAMIVFNKVLTPTQVAAIGANMAAL